MIAIRNALSPRVLPQVPRVMWREVRRLWRREKNTQEIAALIGYSEAQVYNSLAKALTE